eukprot:NODE_22508_length_705_cov_2.532872.p1 GENE.NODE_22508_length_705_cov_2.532872~~NODE_22508_length_705_cov_2.532872.p1  ORF type:complete len:227 (-),score=75.45 NODE_22508_length_705_cov_2.532872:23-625(-)
MSEPLAFTQDNQTTGDSLKHIHMSGMEAADDLLEPEGKVDPLIDERWADIHMSGMEAADDFVEPEGKVDPLIDERWADIHMSGMEAADNFVEHDGEGHPVEEMPEHAPPTESRPSLSRVTLFSRVPHMKSIAAAEGGPRAKYVGIVLLCWMVCGINLYLCWRGFLGPEGRAKGRLLRQQRSGAPVAARRASPALPTPETM